MSLSTEEWQEKLDNPDPRIKWAMDVMDREGNDFEGFLGRIWAPASSAIFPVAGNTARNITNRVPLRTNLPVALVLTPVFGLLGHYTRSENAFNVFTILFLFFQKVFRQTACWRGGHYETLYYHPPRIVPWATKSQVHWQNWAFQALQMVISLVYIFVLFRVVLV